MTNSALRQEPTHERYQVLTSVMANEGMPLYSELTDEVENCQCVFFMLFFFISSVFHELMDLLWGREIIRRWTKAFSHVVSIRQLLNSTLISCAVRSRSQMYNLLFQRTF